jgi:FkbM family methyltransferase
MSDFMVDYIKMVRDNSFYKSEKFYTSLDVNTYKLENLGDIKDVEGGTIEIADKYGWARAIYHEIFNLYDYYKDRNVKQIHEGDTVVDLGGNMGIFNRWAYSQGASKVISFEPDKRYFKLLSLNADPRSILFNAAMSHEIGELNLYESNHLGGSNVFEGNGATNYPVRTYTLNYLFESGLVDKIDFLKVDIEGAEHAAFKGISDENLMKVRTIAMEYHHSFFNYDDELRETFIKRLNKLGFNSYLLFCGNNNSLQLIYFSR